MAGNKGEIIGFVDVDATGRAVGPTPPAGMVIPIDAIAIDTVTYAAFVPPGNDLSELGWSGGSPGAATLSNVQTQPANAPYTGTNKYWHLTTANSTFTTNPVDVSGIAGQTLKGHIELSFYSTSATTLDAGDVLNAKLEVALDGNFANTAAGNILTSVFVDLPTGSTAAEATDLSAALANLLKTLPALRNPTISQLSLPGWVAVETIIDEHIVREIIPQLKAAGGRRNHRISFEQGRVLGHSPKQNRYGFT